MILNRRLHVFARSLSRVSQQSSVNRPSSFIRKYTASTANSSQSIKANPIPTPQVVQSLRSKEHRLRRSIFQGLIVATIIAYYLDGKYNARAIRRTIRTAWVGATLAADYKWNFTFIHSTLLALTTSPEKADQIENLHKRVARRIMDLISSNGGLYIKLGLSLCMLN